MPRIISMALSTRLHNRKNSNAHVICKFSLNCSKRSLKIISVQVLCLIRAARCDNATAALMFCCSFFLFLFSARSRRFLCRSPRNFATWSEMGAILKTRSKIRESSPKKIWGRKTCFFRYDFGRLHTSITNISGKEQDIYNHMWSTIGKRRCKQRSLRRLQSADVMWWTCSHSGVRSGAEPRPKIDWCILSSNERIWRQRIR